MTGKKKRSSAPLPSAASSEPTSSLSFSSSSSPLSNECNWVFGILHKGTYSKALEAAKSLVSCHPDSALANALITLVYKDIAASELSLSLSLSQTSTLFLSLSLSKLQYLVVLVTRLRVRLVCMFKNWKLLFKNICENTCGWKSVLKCVKCCLKIKNCCLKTQTKHHLNVLMFFMICLKYHD